LSETLRSYRGVLQLPGMSRLLLAACFSRLAGRMFMLAIVLYVLERFRSPALVGWIAFAAMAPGLAISPLAGALLDRVGAARAIVINMAASAAILFALAGLDFADSLSFPLLVVLVTLYSLTAPLGSAGVRTMIPNLTPDPMLDRANALDTTIYALVDILGPVLAGALIGFTGALVTLSIIAALFVMAGASLRSILRLPRTAYGRQTSSLLSEAIAGVRHVLANRSLLGIAVTYSLYQASWGALLVIVPVVVGKTLGEGPIEDMVVGALWTGAGIAGAIGALVTGHLRTTGRERSLVVAGTLATAVGIYPIAALFGLSGLVVGLLVVGLCAGSIDVGVLSLRQRRTDRAWLGRVLAVSISLNMAGLPIGSALGGLIVGGSVDLAFVLTALAAAVAALAAHTLVPRRA
jgi:MFS family permease